jgi:predicted transcriptional regulator
MGRKNKEDEALDLDTRRRIFDFLKTAPGTHFRELERQLSLPTGVIAYHLKYLEDADMIVGKVEGRYKRYYIEGKMGSKDKKLMSVLRQEIPRRILMHLIMNPGSTHKQLKVLFTISPSTLSFHIKKLVDVGAITKIKEGRESFYFVENEEEIAKALISYKRSFLDSVVDSFTNTWMEMNLKE